MFTSGNGDRQDSPNIVVVMTDGSSNDKKKTQEEAFKVGYWDGRYYKQDRGVVPLAI